MPGETQVLRESRPTTEQPRPWEQDRTTRVGPVKQWRRALMSPHRPTRYKARALLAGVVIAEAAGAAGGALLAADALLPIQPVDPGLVPHPTPGIEPVPPIAQ